MAGRKLAVNTTAVDEDGRMVTFLAGTTVTAEVAKGITNPKAWGDEPDSGGGSEPEQPAKKAAPAKKSAAKKAADSSSK